MPCTATSATDSVQSIAKVGSPREYHDDPRPRASGALGLLQRAGPSGMKSGCPMSQIRRQVVDARVMAEHLRPSEQRPSCPACSERMQLTRVVPRGINYLWEQVVF